MEYGGWEIIEELGHGGQGTVYLARNASRVTERLESRNEVIRHSSSIAGTSQRQEKLAAVDDLAKRLHDIAVPDDPRYLGALKVFDLPSDAEEREQAKGRFKDELDALQSLKHLSILRLLEGSHLDVPTLYMVTEFHPGGTLDQHLNKFKGKVLESLQAFLPLVDAVMHLHEQKKIHRDIKTKNIFVAADGRLVLGDLGIVFFLDRRQDRRTTTYEKVGTTGWMAPWALENLRLEVEKVNPKLDIFPLGKVLWSLIAGRDGFVLWDDYKTPNKNLEVLFPNDPAMGLVNQILAKCIVRNEGDCIESARELHDDVAGLIAKLKRGAQRIDGARTWPCRMCGQGSYQQHASTLFSQLRKSAYAADDGVFGFLPFVCDHCKHVEFFMQ